MGVAFEQIIALTAERRLSEHEHDSEPDSSQDATEWRNLLRYLTQVLGGLEHTAHQTCGQGNQHWRDEHYTAPSGQAVRLLVAPSSDPARRANSTDAVAFFAERVARAPSASALLVTSAIYAPYQYFATAPALLRHGVGYVELVGTATSMDGSRLRLAQRVAQEIHAGIHAAVAAADAGA